MSGNWVHVHAHGHDMGPCGPVARFSEQISGRKLSPKPAELCVIYHGINTRKAREGQLRLQISDALRRKSRVALIPVYSSKRSNGTR
jgi:hypothetical protein